MVDILEREVDEVENLASPEKVTINLLDLVGELSRVGRFYTRFVEGTDPSTLTFEKYPVSRKSFLDVASYAIEKVEEARSREDSEQLTAYWDWAVRGYELIESATIVYWPKFN
ncbi:hypothetical protein HN604_00320 [archaeon]|jgi:hypothetical protein|nr:hypothetical protein [archaeon]MBT6182840.1 hypothetical protein [archaeon]MBT6606800.1 hypothetical protein [archaeon]MBT7251727.1 hypothetical protein [archaeon]MBT7660510.1 hypothetical protein [archaeon]